MNLVHVALAFLFGAIGTIIFIVTASLGLVWINLISPRVKAQIEAKYNALAEVHAALMHGAMRKAAKLYLDAAHKTTDRDTALALTAKSNALLEMADALEGKMTPEEASA